MIHENLKGRVAVVTGGGGVLCGQFAKTLAKQGCKVAVLDLNEAAAQKCADEIISDGGDRRFAALLLGCGGQGLARGGQQLFKFRKSCLFALPLNFRTGPSSRPIPVLFSDRVRHSFSMPPSILPALTIP